VQAAATYSNLWVSSLTIRAPDVHGDANAFVNMIPYTINADGSKTSAPGNSTVSFSLKNLLKLAETDGTLLSLMNSLLAYITTQGQAAGVIGKPS
jgi:hypothetical protein